MDTRDQDNVRIGALDGLRAIALLLVLLWHFTPGRISATGIQGTAFKIADVGWLGVDLFFVLSGFLITRILLATRDGSYPVRTFYRNRFLRILPAYYCALLIAFGIVPVFTGVATPLHEQLPYWLYYANWIAAPVGPVGLGHFWSLAVETQFYLAWPLLVLHLDNRVVTRAGIAMLVAACIGRAAMCVVGESSGPWMAMTPLRLDGLVLGALVALGLAHRRLPPTRWVLGVLALGMSIVGWIAWFGHGTEFWKPAPTLRGIVLAAGLPLIASAAFAAVLILSLSDNLVARALDASWFKTIAKLSYGAYVFHFLLVPYLEAHYGPPYFAQWIQSEPGRVYAYLLFATSITFVLALASYHLIERPFLALKRQSSSPVRAKHLP